MSNDAHSRLIDLLKEIDLICRENGIKYCISPDLVLSSIRNKDIPADYLTPRVLMTIEDCNKFIEAVEFADQENRSIEYMGNSANYCSYSVSYVDVASTYIELKRGYDFSQYGLKVIIEIIRPKVSNKLVSALEYGWESNGYRAMRKLKPVNLIAMAIVRCMMIVGKERLGKILFSYFSKVYSMKSRKNNTVFIRRFKKEKQYFKGQLFEETCQYELSGHLFTGPDNAEEYLTKTYGVKWREEEIEIPNGASTVVLPNIKYTDFLNYLKGKNCSIEDLFELQRKTLLTKNFSASSKHIISNENAWRIACRSGERLRFYEEFQKKKVQINNLYADKAYRELDMLFAEHEAVTLEYLKMGLGFCVNKEIFDIQCELLENRGEFEYVKRLKELVPKEHYESIKTM